MWVGCKRMAWRYAMKNAMYWIVLGGLSFWVPITIISAVFWDQTSVVAMNVVSVLGLVILDLACRALKKRKPRWGWVLAGIYILGPFAMLMASEFTRIPSSPRIPGDTAILIMFCLFPPMTLWMAMLNGTILSVVAVTVVLPLLAIYQKR